MRGKHAAIGMHEGIAGRHLAGASSPCELAHGLDDMGQTARQAAVTEREEPAVRVEREGTMRAEIAARGAGRRFAPSSETDLLQQHGQRDRERVVDAEVVDILYRHASFIEGSLGCAGSPRVHHAAHGAQVLVKMSLACATQPNGRVRAWPRRHEHSRTPIGNRTAIQQSQRSRDHLGCQHIRDLHALSQVRDLSNRLRPSALDDLGLVAALRTLVEDFSSRTRLQVALAIEGVNRRFPSDVEVAIYRIVTEALTNVVRHAAATRCWLRIDAGEAVDIEVVDDGVGIRVGAPRGIGLTAMHERVAELGGTVTLSANRPHGTRLHVRLPAALP